MRKIDRPYMDFQTDSNKINDGFSGNNDCTFGVQDGNGGYVAHGMENVTNSTDMITILLDN